MNSTRCSGIHATTSLVVCAGGAEVMQLHEEVVDVHVEAMLEGDERGSGLELAPLHGLPQPSGRRIPMAWIASRHSVVADDGGVGQQAVAVGVVAVLMGVHEHAGAASRRRPSSALHRVDGVEKGAGAPFGGAAVDAQHGALAEDEPGVVDPPSAVGLDVGVDVLGHLLGPRRSAARRRRGWSWFVEVIASSYHRRIASCAGWPTASWERWPGCSSASSSGGWRSSSGEAIAPGVPTVLVANHTNGLVDGLLLMAALRRYPRFLGKSTLFKILPLRPFLKLAGVVPVYRAKDGESTAQNAGAFAMCRRLLAQGGMVAFFPEGVSHDEPSPAAPEDGRGPDRPRGRASTTTCAESSPWPSGWPMTPRRASGPAPWCAWVCPQPVSAWAERYGADDHEATRALTDDMAARDCDRWAPTTRRGARPRLLGQHRRGRGPPPGRRAGRGGPGPA